MRSQHVVELLGRVVSQFLKTTYSVDNIPLGLQLRNILHIVFVANERKSAHQIRLGRPCIAIFFEELPFSFFNFVFFLFRCHVFIYQRAFHSLRHRTKYSLKIEMMTMNSGPCQPNPHENEFSYNHANYPSHLRISVIRFGMSVALCIRARM